MRKLILTTTALISLSASTGFANVLADTVVKDLQTQGYTSIEVYVGPTQLKAEGYQPGLKIEVIRDLVTGAVLKQEIETLSPEDADDDQTPGIEIEDVPEDFLDPNGEEINDDDSPDDEDDDDSDDDEAVNDPLANQVTAGLQARGYTSIETLVGPTQVRSEGYNATGAKIEVIYDRATGLLIREVAETGSPDDDDYTPGIKIEDVPFDFVDSAGNDIMPDDEDDIEDEIEDIEDDLDDENEDNDDNDDSDDSDDDSEGDSGGDDGDSDGGDDGHDGGDSDGGGDGGDGGGDD